MAKNRKNIEGTSSDYHVEFENKGMMNDYIGNYKITIEKRELYYYEKNSEILAIIFIIQSINKKIPVILCNIDFNICNIIS